ncbi:MAG: GNAT family N-acetyltransferase [Marinosulfonomonas sp.]|nr:GNAT family N-acetyltransferase [Marinosulfonomonas sp.]
MRKARIADTDALVACIQAAYAQYKDRISDLPAVADGCAEDIQKNQAWVAVEDDKIVGCVILNPGDGFLKLANLAVDPDCRGLGIGRLLIDFSQQEASDQGFSEMRLNTHAAMAENIQLYTHLGWRETGRVGNSVAMKISL